MQLLILHYHLNRGGVTSVIENHCRALATRSSAERPTRIVIAYGGRAAAWNEELADQLPMAVTTEVVPALDYDGQRVAMTVEGLVDQIQHLLSESGFHPEETVIHVHNHSLGKNAALPAALIQLARLGWRLLLQIHDFAEDLRPANYQHLLKSYDSTESLHDQLYPQGSHIHYAVLNGRDRVLLDGAGLAAQRLHWLPNPVSARYAAATDETNSQVRQRVLASLDIPQQHRYLLYPVRAIRRKNLGELLLWAAATKETTFAVTLAPLNVLERPNYERWKQHAEGLELNVRFDVGGAGGHSLADNYAACDGVITTSVAEGFGLVYLEACLADRPLVGRALPGITDDFIQSGMQFPGLRDSLSIPIDWIDVDEMKQRYARLITELRSSFRMPISEPAALQAEVDREFSGDEFDFGRLDSASQRAIVQRVSEKAESRERLHGLNPTLALAGCESTEDDKARLKRNRTVVDQAYSLDVIGALLAEVYQSVLSSKLSNVVGQPAVAQSILARFVQPNQLFPIRLES